MYFLKGDSKAAKRFLLKLRKQGVYPRLIVTDKLKSHISDKGENKRAENSHQATRLRERKMRKFKSIQQAQKFLTYFGRIYDHFTCVCHKVGAKIFRIMVSRRLTEWREITQVAPAA